MTEPEEKKIDDEEVADNPLFQCFGSSYAEAYEATLGVQETVDPLHQYELGATERRVDDARELQSQEPNKKKPRTPPTVLIPKVLLIILTAGVLAVTVMYFAGGMTGIF